MSRLVLEQEFKLVPFRVSDMVSTLKSFVDMECSPAIKRDTNFWTIGSASYKDKDRLDKITYESFVKSKNHALLHYFENFYKHQLEYFSHLLQAECRYMKNTSLPGFHVFKYCKQYEQALARPHVDIPFNKFDWGQSIGYDKIFTHVAAVEIPDDAGMFVWDVTAEDIHKNGVDNCLALCKIKEDTAFIQHEVDMACIHSGRFAHQIKPFSGHTNKWRITLQSHAVFIDGVWYLYW